MGANDHTLTAAEYAAGLRALADVLEAEGLPASIRFPKQALSMNLYVDSPAVVQDFALTHDLRVKVSGTHTTTHLALGPNPNTYYDGSVVLTVVHIDDEPEEAPVEEPEPTPAPEPVYLEIDGVVMKTTSDDSNLPDLLDYGWQQITEAEALSWQPLDGVADEPVHVPPTPALSPQARTALADVLSSVAAQLAAAGIERMDPDDPTSMVRPLAGDQVLLADGTQVRVLGLQAAVDHSFDIDRYHVLDPANGRRVVDATMIAGYPEGHTPKALTALTAIAIRDSGIKDSSGGAVPKPNPAPSDDASLAAPAAPRTPLKELLAVLAADFRRGDTSPNLHTAYRTYLEATR